MRYDEREERVARLEEMRGMKGVKTLKLRYETCCWSIWKGGGSSKRLEIGLD